jgi:retinol dehydrogenase-12
MFSLMLKAENNGCYIMAWGRTENLPADITKGLKSKDNGGSGGAQMIWNYCEHETQNFI